MAWKKVALDANACRKTCRDHIPLSHRLKKAPRFCRGGPACPRQGVQQPPHCPAQPSPRRSGCKISSWLRLWHTWPLSGCQRRLPGLPVRQTSRPWHQVGNKPRTAPEGIFSPPSPSATQMRGKSLSQPLPSFPKSSQGKGTSQIMYFCTQRCLVQRFLLEHQPLSPCRQRALPGGLLFRALLLHSLHPKAPKAQKATASTSAEGPQLHRPVTGD